MNLKKFATSMQQAVTNSELLNLLQNYLAHFKIASYAITFYSGHIKTGRKICYEYASEPLRPWHNYYLEQGYADIDRTLEGNSQTTFPIFWDVQLQLVQARNKRERRMREESIEFGIDKGLSIPVFGPNDDFVALTLHQRRGETCLTQYKIHQYEWLTAAILYYSYSKSFIQVNHVNPIYSLTAREKQCLHLTAESWRVEKIARELNISERTVNFHLQNANKKLGTNNKYQAINKYFT